MPNGQLAPQPLFTAFGTNGLPLVGGQLFTFQAGTSFQQATFTDASLTTPNTNPVILNAFGEAAVWLSPGQAYKFNLFDSQGNQMPGYPVDNINGSVAFSGIASNLIPSITNTFTLGTPGLSWEQLYLGPNSAPAYSTLTGNILYYAPTPAEVFVSAAVGTQIVVNGTYPPMCVDRYFTNTGTNDSAPAFGYAFLVAQASQGGTITYCAYGATGPYMTLGPINFTTANAANNYPVTLLGPGLGAEFVTQTIIANHGGNSWNHVIDLTGTVAFTMIGVAIGTMTSGTTFPTTGIFQSRGSSGSSVGICRFYNVSVLGQFTNSCYYNYAAEDCEHYGMHLYNSYLGGPTTCKTITASNVGLLTSHFQGVFGGGAIASRSCLTHKWFGGEYINTSTNSVSFVTYLETVGAYRSYGELSFASSTTTPLGANVFVDLTYGASSQCTFDCFRTDTANNAMYAFAFSDNAFSAVGFSFNTMFTASTSYSLAGLGTDGVQTMLNWRVGQWTENAARGINWPGTAHNCYFTTGELAVTIGTASTGNIFIGNSAQLTVNSGAFTVMNTHAPQSDGWGGTENAAVVNNYNASSSTTLQDKQAIASLIALALARGGFGV
jgi:hypothetical protein